METFVSFVLNKVIFGTSFGLRFDGTPDSFAPPLRGRFRLYLTLCCRRAQGWPTRRAGIAAEESETRLRRPSKVPANRLGRPRKERRPSPPRMRRGRRRSQKRRQTVARDRRRPTRWVQAEGLEQRNRKKTSKPCMTCQNARSSSLRPRNSITRYVALHLCRAQRLPC